MENFKKLKMTSLWILFLLSIISNSTAKFLHFPTTSSRSDTLFLPSNIVRPTGRPGLQTVQSERAEAAQALLQFVGSSLLDRGSLNPRKRAKEAALITASDSGLVLESEVNIGEYADHGDQTQTVRLRPPGSDQTENFRPPSSGQGGLRTRPRVKMTQSVNSEPSRGRNRVTTPSPSPPPPKKRFTILRSGDSREGQGILVSNRENILAREGQGGTKKKITLLEDSRRRKITKLK